MSKFNIVFLPINIRAIVFKLFIPNKKISFAKFGYCYNHLFLMVIYSKLYFDIVYYWSFLVYTVISILYKN